MFPNYLEVEKLVPSYFEPHKPLLQLFGERKKWIPAIWRPKNVIHNCQEQGKILCHLFKVRKNGSQQLEARNNVSQLFGSAKNWYLAISSLTNIAASIWREKSGSLLFGDQKNVVHNCQEQGKRV